MSFVVVGADVISLAFKGDTRIQIYNVTRTIPIGKAS